MREAGRATLAMRTIRESDVVDVLVLLSAGGGGRNKADGASLRCEWEDGREEWGMRLVSQKQRPAGANALD